MTKVMTRVIEELKATLKIEQDSMDKADGMSDWDNYHQYKGWVEALEYSIRLIENESCNYNGVYDEKKCRGKND